MFTVELFSLALRELEHLEIRDGELSLSLRDDLTDIEVGIGLDHTIGPAHKRKSYLLVCPC